MWTIFSLPLFWYALVVLVLVSILAGLLGTLIVLRRGGLVTDAIGHAGLAGVALGLFTGVTPLLGSLVYAGLVGLLVPRLAPRQRVSLDTWWSVVMAGSLGLAVLLFALLPDRRVGLEAYLFGSLLWVTPGLVWLTAAWVGVVLTIWWGFGRQFLLWTIDPDYAKVIGLPVQRLQLLLELMIVVSVVLSIRVAGAILVGALFVIPAAAAALGAHSLRQSQAWSLLSAMLCAVLGWFLAVIFNAPPGATVALATVAWFLIALLLRAPR